MLISNISRQCLIKLKEYSDEKNNSQRRRLPSPTNNKEGLPLVDFAVPSAASDIDRSLLGRLLSCKPCRKITECERHKKVRRFEDEDFLPLLYSRNVKYEIWKLMKQICIGNIKLKNTMLKHKKPMKFKKNLIIFGTGNRIWKSTHFVIRFRII